MYDSLELRVETPSISKKRCPTDIRAAIGFEEDLSPPPPSPPLEIGLNKKPLLHNGCMLSHVLYCDVDKKPLLHNGCMLSHVLCCDVDKKPLLHNGCMLSHVLCCDVDKKPLLHNGCMLSHVLCCDMEETMTSLTAKIKETV